MLRLESLTRWSVLVVFATFHVVGHGLHFAPSFEFHAKRDDSVSKCGCSHTHPPQDNSLEGGSVSGSVAHHDHNCHLCEYFAKGKVTGFLADLPSHQAVVATSDREPVEAPAGDFSSNLGPRGPPSIIG